MTAAQNPLLGRAWLGYAMDESQADVVARVCDRCPDREAVEREAVRLRLRITRGICDRCAGRQLELLNQGPE